LSGDAAPSYTENRVAFCEAPNPYVFPPVNPDEPYCASRLSIWSAAYGTSNITSGNPSVTGSHEAAFLSGASVTGVDYRPVPDTLLGFALAGGGTSWELLQGPGGSGRSDVFQAGVYGSQSNGPAYLSGALAFAEYWASTDRTVTIAGQAQLFRTPAYSEMATFGSPQFALAFDAHNAFAARSELGSWFDKTSPIDGGTITLFGRAAWVHDWISDPALTASFQRTFSPYLSKVLRRGEGSGAKRPSQPETIDVVPVGGAAPATAGRAEVLRTEVPRTAAEDTETAVSRYPRRTIPRSSCVGAIPAILHPLIQVSVHVVETERIGFERPDRRRLLVVPLAAAVLAVRVPLADLVAPEIFRRCASARRIFPFSLGEQPVGNSKAGACWMTIRLGFLRKCAAVKMPAENPLKRILRR
jgi:Autotransporter beta-domain